jgi:CubicO group peptidase (beta-lactamase class C family)
MQPVSDAVRHYGYQWWLKPCLGWKDTSAIPDSTIIAWGIYTQQVFVIPEERIVIARLGNDIPATDGWDEIDFLTLVMEAVE